MIEYTYRPGFWMCAGIAVALAVVILASYLSAKGRSSRGMRLGLSAIRWVTLAALALCLLNPEWVEALKRQQRARVAVLLDTSRSMAIKDLPQDRLASAKNWLNRELLPSFPASLDVSYFSFNDNLTALPGPEGGHTGGKATGLADALDNLLALPNDAPLAGVIVCSDGLENVRKDPDASARTYRRKGISIHTLLSGTTNESRDVVLENVQVRRAVPNQAPTKVMVSLRAPGYAQQTVPVQILHDDELVAVRDVQLTEKEQKVEIDFTPRQKGFQTYEARIPAQPEEWLTANNRRVFGLDVIDPTIRVLYMEGTPQQPNSPIPEWKYLKGALESDPNIKVTTLYREFGATGKRLNVADTDPETGEKIYPVEHPTRGFPQTLSRLLEYDVVIHSDIRKESFNSEELQNMARLVEEFGGGFVMIGGNSAFGKGGYHRTVLDKIIPMAMHQEKDSQAIPFHLQVPNTAWSHPIIAFGRTRAETELIWTTKFPVLYGCNVVERVKPGAAILGYDPTTPTATGARLILAVQSVGRGRTMAFTSDTTRTWGKDFETLWGEKLNPNLPLSEENCDGRYYRQFWVNAVRWLAAGRAGRTNTAVTLELAQSHCLPGEKIVARITARDPSMRPTSAANVNLLMAQDGRTNQLPQPIFDNVTRTYLAEFALTNSGTFVISATANQSGVTLGDDRQLLVCEDTDREMDDLRAKPELLVELSRISGGLALTLKDRATDLIESLASSVPPVTVEYRRNPLWDRTWLMGALLTLLAVEWGLRRWTGMA